ncbi:MAG: cation diffusion facilitator family transporter [Dehalococcoidales bacterium]|nr:cation diffusion facilitator family transporter [Dehalococcoidales bacterium]
MVVHVHNETRTIASKLRFAIILSTIILVAEVAGGLLSRSLALLSDAGHVLTDVIALSLSWYGVRQAERPASSRMTFGYHRVGVMIAIINALAIFIIAGVIFYEAYQRFQQPPEINSVLMLSVAVVGLGVNLFVAFWLHKEQRANLNVRSVFWHVLSDTLASVGVIIGGGIMLFTQWFWLDPVISAFIGLVILWAAWLIFKEGLSIILEATPYQVDVEAMVHALTQIPGVKEVHDIHVWSITSELHAMSGHVLIDDILISQAVTIRQKIEDLLRQQFYIGHTAIQMECQECGCGDIFCRLDLGTSSDENKKPPSQPGSLPL